MLHRMVPIAQQLLAYHGSTLGRDLLAGVTVAADSRSAVYGPRATPAAGKPDGCGCGHARKRLRAFSLDNVTASQQA
jgi:hypothetical protein